MDRLEGFFADLNHAVAGVRCTLANGEEIGREEAYRRTLTLALVAADKGGKQMFIGNGGSAAIASHMAIDFSKNGGLPAMCFNDGAALTCLGNDFGYEEVFARQIGYHGRKEDLLFAISSSGSSPSILRAVDVARRIGCAVVTMSGFKPTNPLRKMGEVNFHVNLEDYGVVEVAHTVLIHAVVEMKRANWLAAAQVAD